MVYVPVFDMLRAVRCDKIFGFTLLEVLFTFSHDFLNAIYRKMTDLVPLTENHHCGESGFSLLECDDELAFRITELMLKYLKEMESARRLM